jgi:hypothetical protein
MDRMVSRARFAATVVWAISLAAAIGSVVLLAMSWDRALTDDLFSGVGGLSFATMSVAFASVGAIITARVVDNAVGLLFLAIGLMLAAACSDTNTPLTDSPARAACPRWPRRRGSPTRYRSRQRR